MSTTYIHVCEEYVKCPSTNDTPRCLNLRGMQIKPGQVKNRLDKYNAVLKVDGKTPKSVGKLLCPASAADHCAQTSK